MATVRSRREHEEPRLSSGRREHRSAPGSRHGIVTQVRPCGTRLRLMSQVPAATRTLMVLRFLAAQPDPVPLDRLASALDLPRSTAYHLVNAMIEQGFVTHIAEERRYCLGVAAFEVGIGYARQAPLQRIAHRPLAALVDRIGHSAHLAVPHGRDVLYVLEERAPGRAPLVTDVGVRLPAHLTASGRAIMAAMPPSQVRALYPDQDRVRRPPRARPTEPERPAERAERDPAARLRHRGRGGHAGVRVGGGGGAGPQRHPARRHRHHLRDPGERRPRRPSWRRCPPPPAP